jgi:hypothetical protein
VTLHRPMRARVNRAARRYEIRNRSAVAVAASIVVVVAATPGKRRNDSTRRLAWSAMELLASEAVAGREVADLVLDLPLLGLEPNERGLVLGERCPRQDSNLRPAA